MEQKCYPLPFGKLNRNIWHSKFALLFKVPRNAHSSGPWWMKIDLPWTWSTWKKCSASKSSCSTATRRLSAPLITHRFTTGACATMLIGSKTSEDHRTTSSISRRDARIYLMMEAGRLASTTSNASTLIPSSRFCSTPWTTSWMTVTIEPLPTSLNARNSPSCAVMRIQTKRRSRLPTSLTL